MPDDVSKDWITVLSPTLTDNAVFRTWVILKLLAPHYRIQLVGFGHPGESYAPLAGDPLMVPDITYHAETIWGWYRQVRAMKSAVRGRAIVCIKPKLPSFGAGLLLGRWLGRPVIVDVDDWERGFLFPGSPDWEFRYYGLGWLTKPTSPLYVRWLEGRIMSAAAVLVSNTFLQGMFGGHWIPHMRSTDQPPSQPTRRADGRKVVLFAGKPRTHKGVGTLLAAWRLMARHDAVLHLVVSDPKTEVAGLGLESFDNVEVSGPYPFAELQRLLGEASVVVVPQDNARAALGQLPAKLLDAMAAARPIVATDVGDASRWLAGGAGVVVAPGSPDDLAAGIGYLLDHPAGGAAMGAKARARLAQWASEPILSDRLHRVVEGVLNGDPPAAEPAFGGIFTRV